MNRRTWDEGGERGMHGGREGGRQGGRDGMTEGGKEGEMEGGRAVLEEAKERLRPDLRPQQGALVPRQGHIHPCGLCTVQVWGTEHL